MFIYGLHFIFTVSAYWFIGVFAQPRSPGELQSLWHGGGDNEGEAKATVLVIPPSRICLHGL